MRKISDKHRLRKRGKFLLTRKQLSSGFLMFLFVLLGIELSQGFAKDIQLDQQENENIPT